MGASILELEGDALDTAETDEPVSLTARAPELDPFRVVLLIFFDIVLSSKKKQPFIGRLLFHSPR